MRPIPWPRGWSPVQTSKVRAGMEEQVANVRVSRVRRVEHAPPTGLFVVGAQALSCAVGSSRNERKQLGWTADFSHLKDLSPFVPRVTPVQKHRGEPGHTQNTGDAVSTAVSLGLEQTPFSLHTDSRTNLNRWRRSPPHPRHPTCCPSAPPGPPWCSPADSSGRSARRATRRRALG